MRLPPLYEELRGVDCAALAARLGLVVGRGRSWGPCPCCGAERRGGGDKRGPLGVARGGAGWACHRPGCTAKGDAAALVLAVATGSLDAGADGWAAARELAASVGLAAPAVVSPGGPPERAEHPARVVRPPAPARPSEAPKRPPAVEVRRLWDAARAVDEDEEVAAWLRSRGLEPSAVAWLDAARVLPAGPLPRWARCSGTPWSSGWRCLLPAFDAEGQLVTLRARWASTAKPPRGVKEAAPAGFDAGGAVYACPYARGVLACAGVEPVGLVPVGPRSDGFGFHLGAWNGRAVVVEGGPAWLRFATEARPLGKPSPAVVGVWAGAWCEDFARALELGVCRGVTVATDSDASGDKYAARIGATLDARAVPWARWR